MNRPGCLVQQHWELKREGAVKILWSNSYVLRGGCQTSPRVSRGALWSDMCCPSSTFLCLPVAARRPCIGFQSSPLLWEVHLLIVKYVHKMQKGTQTVMISKCLSTWRHASSFAKGNVNSRIICSQNSPGKENWPAPMKRWLLRFLKPSLQGWQNVSTG